MDYILRLCTGELGGTVYLPPFGTLDPIETCNAFLTQKSGMLGDYTTLHVRVN